VSAGSCGMSATRLFFFFYLGQDEYCAGYDQKRQSTPWRLGFAEGLAGSNTTPDGTEGLPSRIAQKLKRRWEIWFVYRVASALVYSNT
jgi:hypothetical protein